jgi:hypothetical protein
MRIWEFWWRTLVFSTQYNPPVFVELVMLLLTMALLLIWGFFPDWPYLVLSSSLAIGAAGSMWVRESIIPSPHRFVVLANRILPILLVIYSVYLIIMLCDFLNVS